MFHLVSFVDIIMIIHVSSRVSFVDIIMSIHVSSRVSFVDIHVRAFMFL